MNIRTESALAAAAASAGTSAKASLVGTVGGALASGVAWAERSGLLTLTGALVAVFGVVLTWYFSKRRLRLEGDLAAARIEALHNQNRREQERHDAYMRGLRNSCQQRGAVEFGEPDE